MLTITYLHEHFVLTVNVVAEQEQLRDQLFEQTNSTRIRERLLVESDWKLDKALN